MVTTHHTPRGNGPAPTYARLADGAYRRAWWSLALYPVAFLAGFVLGEGLFFLLTGGEEPGDPEVWTVLLSAVPALLVMVLPGALAVHHGRRASRFGRPDGWVPATVGALLALGAVVVNAVSFVLGRIVA